MSISVVYWSGTGNTQAMAEAVAEGIKAAGQEAELLEVGDADAKTVAEEAAFALGCPAMGAEVLEESEMEPFVEELESYVSGKKILLFGSYGWGDGEWMRDWADRMKNAGSVKKESSQMRLRRMTYLKNLRQQEKSWQNNLIVNVY